MALVPKDDYNQVGQKPLTQITQLDKKRRKQLLEEPAGTAFDAYTRMFASFGQGDVFEVGEWRARDIDLMLRRDGDAAMVEQALTLLPAQASYSLEKQPGDRGEYELCQRQLFTPAEAGGFSPGMQTVIPQMAEACIYRKEFFEKKYVYDGTEVKLTNLEWRPPSTCDIRRDEHTARFDGFRQRAWWYATSPGNKAAYERTGIGGKNFTGFLDIPKIRAYVLIHGVRRQPLVGTSDLEVCYWAYKQKAKILFLWLQFLENQALPKLAVYGADQPQADEAALTLSTMRGSAVGGFIRPPQGGKLFDVIESGGTGSAEFQAALKYLAAYQTNSCLASFLTLSSQAMFSGGGYGARGSYALAESAGEFFLKSRQAFVDEMCLEFTRQVVTPICVLNQGSECHPPRLRAEKLSDTQGQLIVSALQALAVSPQLNIPHEYVLMLAQKAADIFDLPIDDVTKLLNSRAAKAMAKAANAGPFAAGPLGQGAAQIAGATQGASQIAANAQAGANPLGPPAIGAPGGNPNPAPPF